MHLYFNENLSCIVQEAMSIVIEITLLMHVELNDIIAHEVRNPIVAAISEPLL